MFTFFPTVSRVSHLMLVIYPIYILKQMMPEWHWLWKIWINQEEGVFSDALKNKDVSSLMHWRTRICMRTVASLLLLTVHRSRKQKSTTKMKNCDATRQSSVLLQLSIYKFFFFILYTTLHHRYNSLAFPKIYTSGCSPTAELSFIIVTFFGLGFNKKFHQTPAASIVLLGETTQLTQSLFHSPRGY